MQASDVIDRASLVLIDPAHERWSESEQMLYLTDGLMAVATVKPEAFAKTDTLALEEGALQNLPQSAESLLSVESLGANGEYRSVTYCDVDLLDRFRPGWRGEEPEAMTLNYAHDARVPNELYVYPPAKAGGELRLRYVPVPARVTSLDQELELSDRYMPALTDYVAYRCFMKDSESPTSAERAMNHLELFNTAVGAQFQSVQQRKPRANQPPERGMR